MPLNRLDELGARVAVVKHQVRIDLEGMFGEKSGLVVVLRGDIHRCNFKPGEELCISYGHVEGMSLDNKYEYPVSPK